MNFARGRLPTCEDHVRSLSREIKSTFSADTVVRACEQDPFPAEVYSRDVIEGNCLGIDALKRLDEEPQVIGLADGKRSCERVEIDRSRSAGDHGE